MRWMRSRWSWIFWAIFCPLAVWGAFCLDASVHAWQLEHNWKNITLLRRYVTRLTDWPPHVIAGLTLAALAWHRGNRRWMRIFLVMVAAGAMAGTFAYGLKVTTGRVRPSVKIDQGWGKHRLSLHRQKYQSFPSGHTAVSTAFFAVLFTVGWRLGLLFLPIPLFVAFTRIFLGAHYLSDVVAATILGIWSALILAHFFLKEKTAPSPLERS